MIALPITKQQLYPVFIYPKIYNYAGWEQLGTKHWNPKSWAFLAILFQSHIYVIEFSYKVASSAHVSRTASKKKVKNTKQLSVE